MSRILSFLLTPIRSTVSIQFLSVLASLFNQFSSRLLRHSFAFVRWLDEIDRGCAAANDGVRLQFRPRGASRSRRNCVASAGGSRRCVSISAPFLSTLSLGEQRKGHIESKRFITLAKSFSQDNAKDLNFNHGEPN